MSLKHLNSQSGYLKFSVYVSTIQNSFTVQFDIRWKKVWRRVFYIFDFTLTASEQLTPSN